MQVLKFGGTSVANTANIEKVVDIVTKSIERDRTILVVSAVSGVTDKLIILGERASTGQKDYLEVLADIEATHYSIISQLISVENQSELYTICEALFSELRSVCEGVAVLQELSIRALDRIMSYGELLSSRIISAKFKSEGINNYWVDSRQIIKTSPYNGQNIVDIDATNKNIVACIGAKSSSLFVFGGFIASDSKGHTTTLGRGGSDYTASLLAVASNSRIVELWTDVCGMMSADPRIVPSARTIRHISYTEALELSHFGAKVVYPPTLSPVVKKGIPIHIKNTFDPEGNYTIIESNPPQGSEMAKGISCSSNIALLSIEGSAMVGAPGYCGRFFNALALCEVNIILITQASSVHTMCVAISQRDADKAKRAVDEVFAYEISLGRVEPLRVESGFSIVSLIGNELKNRHGISGKMFDALGRNGINISAIAQGSSEKNISTVVAQSEVYKAIRVIHEEFFEDDSQPKIVPLFVAGYGNVSKSLIHILQEQHDYICRNYNIDLVVAGVCNSRSYLLDKSGIALSDIENAIVNGSDNSNNQFLEQVLSSQLHNAIFVDCTADSSVASYYTDMFSKKINVVTCNKIANSAPLASYKKLFSTLHDTRSSYRYETTVGAALPIISTIDQIQKSGDRVSKIEAVLSGTLNYIFSSYDATKSFADIIREAKELGYSEPDPRLDLTGTDVLRKLTIIARQIGIEVNQSDIVFKSFLDKSTFEGSLEEFYNRVERREEEFSALYIQSQSRGEKLRFIAKIDSGVCYLSLESIPTSHPFYSLNGTDNAIMIFSEYYKSPLLVQGAGAGGLQTASGVLNDILSTSSL